VSEAGRALVGLVVHGQVSIGPGLVSLFCLPCHYQPTESFLCRGPIAWGSLSPPPGTPYQEKENWIFGCGIPLGSVLRLKTLPTISILANVK